MLLRDTLKWVYLISPLEVPVLQQVKHKLRMRIDTHQNFISTSVIQIRLPVTHQFPFTVCSDQVRKYTQHFCRKLPWFPSLRPSSDSDTQFCGCCGWSDLSKCSWSKPYTETNSNNTEKGKQAKKHYQNSTQALIRPKRGTWEGGGGVRGTGGSL